MPRAKPRTSYCPSCRAVRGIRIVGRATVGGDPVELARCADRDCELVWAIPVASLANAA